MPARFVQKQDAAVEAVQWTGENREEVEELAGPWAVMNGGVLELRRSVSSKLWFRVEPGEWLIRWEGSMEHVWTIPDRVFQATYEESVA